MERINYAKIYQSHGKYQQLVDMAKEAVWQGRAETMETAIEAQCHADPATAQLICDGPKDERNWTYLPIIKRLTAYVDPMDGQTAHLNVIRKALPAYWDAERRGQLMQPASTLVQKAAPDPLPTGMSASEALAHAAAQLIQKGMAPAEAQRQATMEHPNWYEKYLHESRGR